MSSARTVLRRTAPFLLVGAAAVGLVAWMPARAPQEHGRGERGEKGEKGEKGGPGEELEHAMDSMGGAMKALFKGVTAENKDASLGLVARLQSGIVASKGMVPPMAAKIEEAKRAEFVAGYRRKLIEALAVTCKLETAILDNKFDEANALITKDLARIKGEGHDAYQEEEEHRGPPPGGRK